MKENEKKEKENMLSLLLSAFGVAFSVHIWEDYRSNLFFLRMVSYPWQPLVTLTMSLMEAKMMAKSLMDHLSRLNISS